MSGIYDQPEIYELTCRLRNVSAEADAILDWYADLSGGRPRSLLELAAGPAEHAREFARRGIPGVALDLNPAMREYAARKSRESGLDVTAVQGDMTDFQLGRRFDLALTMLDSTCHLMTHEAFTAHLRAVTAHLSDRGLHVIEMNHPGDRLGASTTQSSWELPTPDGLVHIRWGSAADRMDPVTQIVNEQVEVRMPNGRTVTDVVPYRFWSATELRAVIALAGVVEVAAQFGDFDSSVGISDPKAWRLITVLRAPRQ